MIDIFLVFVDRNLFNTVFPYIFPLQQERDRNVLSLVTRHSKDRTRRWKTGHRKQPFSNFPADKLHPRSLVMIFGKKGAAYLRVFTVCWMCMSSHSRVADMVMAPPVYTYWWKGGEKIKQQANTYPASGWFLLRLSKRETTASNRLIFHRACAKYITPHMMYLTSLRFILREITTLQARPNAAVM